MPYGRTQHRAVIADAADDPASRLPGQLLDPRDKRFLAQGHSGMLPAQPITKGHTRFPGTYWPVNHSLHTKGQSVANIRNPTRIYLRLTREKLVCYLQGSAQ